MLLWLHFAYVTITVQILLESDNYVTRRRSLKLLGELLLDRRYITLHCYSRIHHVMALCHKLIPREKSKYFVYMHSTTLSDHTLLIIKGFDFFALCACVSTVFFVVSLSASNFNVMMRFIASEHNLQVVMNLLRDKSANIQFE